MSKTLSVFAALEGEGMESWTLFVVQPPVPGFKPIRNELKLGMRAAATPSSSSPMCLCQHTTSSAACERDGR